MEKSRDMICLVSKLILNAIGSARVYGDINRISDANRFAFVFLARTIFDGLLVDDIPQRGKLYTQLKILREY